MPLDLPPLPDPSGSSLPRRRYRIKPAGWAVIVLAVVGLLYLGWRLVGPPVERWLEARERAPTDEVTSPRTEPEPREPVVVVPPEPVEPEPEPRAPVAEGPGFGPELFPAEVPGLPEPSGFLPRLVLPPLQLVARAQVGAREAGSEALALKMLSEGEADVAVVSVAALAASPEAIRRGVRAAWYLGDSPADGALFPSCEGAVLRHERLSAVERSLGHFHLLAALSDRPLPRIQLLPHAAALAETVQEGETTGGAWAPGASVAAPCRVLPREAFSFVVVRRTEVDLSAGDLASVVALLRGPPPSAQAVATFFDPQREAPNGFADLFSRAGRVWASLGLIESPVEPALALDRSFLPLEPAEPPPEVELEPLPVPEPEQLPEEVPTSPRFGHPSWPDR